MLIFKLLGKNLPLYPWLEYFLYFLWSSSDSFVAID